MQLARTLDQEQTADIQNLRVAKIQRTCVHDGPGIRTVVFFQGCGLRCAWCQNPEFMSFRTDGEGEDRDGNTVDDIVEVVLRDRAYYAASNGGVTLSGGEPLLQHPASLMRLLRTLEQEGIHVAVETALHVPWAHIEEAAPFIDLFLIDLKVVGDGDLHVRHTGQADRRIHENIRRLVGSKARALFRMVVVPGFNDAEKSIVATAELLKSLDHGSITVLKYHNLHETKSQRLGLLREPLEITNDQSIEALRRAAGLFQSLGIRVESFDLGTHRPRAVFTRRVHDIQKEIRESRCHLCLETALLKTEFYKKNGFDRPTHIHRAQSLVHQLRNKKISIYPGELIVGNFTSKRVGAKPWIEYYGVALVSIVHQLDRQKPVPFHCSSRDKLDFYFKIFPFWSRRSLITRMNPSLSSWMKVLARCSERRVGFTNNYAAIAHYIVNHDRILELGTAGIIDQIRAKQEEKPQNNRDFYQGAIMALQGLEEFAQRYSDTLSQLSQKEEDPVRRGELERMAEVCRHVPRHPARTFHEALQSMLFLQIALCTESYENAISLGRVDQLLDPYFRRDQEAGLLTYEEAKELLACFILKIDEVVLVNDGDTYLQIGRLFESLSTVQSVTMGGVDRDGNDATNDVTHMLLDICELQPRGVNMTARIHQGSPATYLERLAEVYISGAPMPALYNDEIYIETLMRHHPTTLPDARNYSIVGCVEPVASDDHFGNTDCANMNVVLPFLQALKGENDDLWNFGISEQLRKMSTRFVEYNFSGDSRFSRAVRSLFDRMSSGQGSTRDCDPPRSMEELLGRFQGRLNHLASSVLADHAALEKTLREHFTTPLASSLFRGCLESGKDVYEGGAKFNSSGIQAVGIPDVADSLFALDEVVFKKRLYDLEEVIGAIDGNFEGERYQQIRAALLEVPKFGDDGSRESQAWVNRVLEIYVKALDSVTIRPRDGTYTAGYYALNVNDIYGIKTPALPSGRPGGVPLAASVGPHYGMQRVDLVSALNSVAGVDFAAFAPNGTSTTFSIDSALFEGEQGIRNLAGLIRAFFREGGMQFQPNVISRETLLDAYEHPERHKDLMVRIAGYCGYFNDLSDELKRIIINRTCYS